MPRKAVNWRSYAPEITSIVVQFQIAGHVKIGPLTKREATAIRTYVYNYRDALWRDYINDEGARELHDIARTMISQMDPLPDNPDQVMLSFLLNPIVALYRPADNPMTRALAAHSALLAAEASQEPTQCPQTPAAS